jgi:Spy/CpxP family protein refolding chaperone
MSAPLKWKLTLGFLLVFLAGAAVGFLIGGWDERPFHFGARQGSLAQRMAERFRNELDLTPEQSAKITTIIEKNAAKLETIRLETGRRVRETFAQTHEQISPLLTPDQRKKLAAMEERHRLRRERHRGFEPPPPPPDQSSPSP